MTLKSSMPRKNQSDHHTRACDVNRHRLNAFTLIELLVVVVIVAVLISLLLPTLKEAKRHAGLITCSSNLKQIGIGLSAYATDENDEYPVSSGTWWAYRPSYGIDNRQMLKDLAGGNTRILYCPISGYPTPEDSIGPGENGYGNDYVYNGLNYSVGYDWWAMYRHAEAAAVSDSYLFTESGNLGNTQPRDHPFESRNTLVVDSNGCAASWDCTVRHGNLGWQHPGRVAHGNTSVNAAAFTPPFRETNALYGDSRVETHPKPVNFVVRQSDGHRLSW